LYSALSAVIKGQLFNCANACIMNHKLLSYILEEHPLKDNL